MSSLQSRAATVAALLLAGSALAACQSNSDIVRGAAVGAAGGAAVGAVVPGVSTAEGAAIGAAGGAVVGAINEDDDDRR